MQLEKDGVDTESIRQQTGWFKSYDGKWRYEIDDSKIHWLPKAKEKFKNADKYYTALSRYNELEEKIKNNTITDNELNEYYDLDEQIVKYTKYFKLSELIEHTKLFEAYPQLKNVKVSFIYEKSYGGNYDAKNNRIHIMPSDDLLRNKKVMVHELQHAIQNIESFAKGSSPKYWIEEIAEQKYTNVSKLKAEVLKASDESFKKKLNHYIKLMESDSLTSDEMINYFNQIAMDITDETLFNKFREYAIAYENYNDYMNKSIEYKQELGDLYYESTAGEIEANDVSYRLNLTEAQRKTNRPDIDRKEVVFSSNNFDNENLAYRYAKQGGIYSDALTSSEWAKFTHLITTGLDAGLRISDNAVIVECEENSGYQYKLLIYDNEIQDNPIKSIYAIGNIDYNITTGNEIGYFINELENKGYDSKKIFKKLLRNHTKMFGYLLRQYNIKSKRYVDIGTKLAENEKYIANQSNGTGVSADIEQRISDEQIKDIRFSLNNATDTEYISAIENGNIEKAQRLVDNAAEISFSDSEVRDNKGKLLKVYHGTDSENFNVFDKSRRGQTDSGVWGRGYYFFSDYDYANDFGKNVRSFYLNMENPYYVSKVSAPAKEIGNYLKSQGIDVNFNYSNMQAHEFIKHFGNQHFTNIMTNLGYDGVIIDDFEYMVFNQNQMKLNDPVAYDDDGNVIPLSERFKDSNNDICYSLSDVTVKDIEDLRSIGRKSINDFTSDEIQKTEKWARKFYEDLGTKSPFFRAWFGDWREYDSKDIKIVDLNVVNQNQGKRGVSNNKDTNVEIQVSKIGVDHIKTHLHRSKLSQFVIDNLWDITENAILFDTTLSEKDSNTKHKNTAFMHNFYVPIRYNGKVLVLKLYVEEFYNKWNNKIQRRDYDFKKIETFNDADRFGEKDSTPLYASKNVSIKNVSDLFSLVKQYDTEFNPKPVSPMVLNKDGTPKVFYHGTRNQFTIFESQDNAKHGRALGDGFYFTDEFDIAFKYANGMFSKVQDRGGIIMPVYVTMKNPYVINLDTDRTKWRKEYSKGEYDGIIDLKNKTYYVENNTQIKSATDNIGTFNKDKVDIRYSLTEPGDITDVDIVDLFEDNEEAFDYDFATDNIKMSYEWQKRQKQEQLKLLLKQQ